MVFGMVMAAPVRTLVKENFPFSSTVVFGMVMAAPVRTLVKENFPSTSYPTPVETFLSRSPFSLLVSENVLALPVKLILCPGSVDQLLLSERRERGGLAPV